MNGGQIDAVHRAFAEKDAEIERLTRLIADIRIKFPEVHDWFLEQFQAKVHAGMAELERRDVGEGSDG